MRTSVYFVGYDEADAAKNLIFDSYESAQSYQQDNKAMKIYVAWATVHLDSMEEVE